MAVVISDQLLDRSDRLLDGEPDEHLVNLAQTGHEAAFAAIVRRYEPELLAQARRLTSDGRAEDAVQQAFLNAFAALRADGEVRHLRGWLHRILRNVVTRARVPADAPLEVELAVSDSLEETVQRRAQAHATLVELSALPERQRDALVGTAVHGLPRAHVAQAMGLSEGAVRQLVHRARRRLRQAATALLPLPLARLFGAARSSAGAAPDAAIGATTAVSGGLAIKVGALLASGVVATGLAVTQTFPGHHHRAVADARHHVAHPRGVTRHLTEAPLTAAAVSAMSAVHRSSAPVHEGGTTAGAGRLHPTRSGRGRPDRTRGAGTRGGEGHGGEGSSSGSTGSGGTDGGGGGSGSTSGRSGSGSSGSGASGSGSGSGSGEDGGSSQSQGTSARDSSGSGHDGPSSGNDGGGSGAGSAAGAVSAVASSEPASSTATVDTTSDHGSGSSGGSGDAGASVDSGGSDGSAGSGGSGGSQKDSGGSRDVSGSLDSSSS